MDDLNKLIAAVEAGDETALGLAGRVFGDVPLTGDVVDVLANNSLDAALRLHEALLPGWRWIIRDTEQGDVDRGECKEGDTGFANVWAKGNPNYGDPYNYAFSATPARAWLLAILRAVKAKGE